MCGQEFTNRTDRAPCLPRDMIEQAMERLDGCSAGGLTSSFVEAVAKSWPGATGEDSNTTSRSPASQPK